MAQNSEKPLVFGYWETRGRGQALRFLLEYIGANYVEKQYSFSNMEEWKAAKAVLAPFPNLPYLVDDDFYISEHDAVINYIVKRHPESLNLLGVGKDEFRVQQIILFTNDIRQALRDLCFNKDRENAQKGVFEAMLPKFKSVIATRGDNQFLLPYLTTADFKFQEILLYAKALNQEFFQEHLSSFEGYLRAFYSLPKISEYVLSERYNSIKKLFPEQLGATFTGEEFLVQFHQQFLGLKKPSE